MNYHYRNETFEHRFYLTILIVFALMLAAVGMYAESERQKYESAELRVIPRETILLDSETWITIDGAGRDAVVRVHHGGVFE